MACSFLSMSFGKQDSDSLDDHLEINRSSNITLFCPAVAYTCN